MAKHLILLDFNANPLFDDDLAEEVSTFGELKLYLNRLSTDDKKSLSWWDNLEVLDSAHNKYEKGDDTLIYDEYDGIENCLVLYTKPKAKKQESGANTERSRILNKIKELNLGKVVKEKYGKNQTQVASPLLLALIKEAEEGVVTADNSRVTVETTEIVETTPTAQSEFQPEKSALTAANPEEEQGAEPEYDEIKILIPKSLNGIIRIETNGKKRNFNLLQANNPFKK